MRRYQTNIATVKPLSGRTGRSLTRRIARPDGSVKTRRTDDITDRRPGIVIIPK